MSSLRAKRGNLVQSHTLLKEIASYLAMTILFKVLAVRRVYRFDLTLLNHQNRQHENHR